MSLRSKITLILAIVVGAYALADNLIQRTLLADQFAALQTGEAGEDLERVRGSLAGEHAALARRAGDWAASAAVTDAARGTEPSALASRLDAGLAVDDLDVAYLCAKDGEVLAARAEDPATGESIQLDELPQGALPASNPLVAAASTGESVSGVLMTDRGALLVGAHPVAGEDGETVGSMILGRFLDQALLDELGGTIHVRFDLWPLLAGSVPDAAPDLVDRVTTAPGPVHVTTDDGELHVYATLYDLRRRSPSILLRARIDPDIIRAGGRSVNYALLSTLATGLLILVVLSRLLSKIVIGPVSRLAELATRIGQTDDTSMRIEMDRDDEIGRLSTEFDSMLEKLELSRQEVIRASRLAGMSEIATGVLHNVGNVLNSVNVSTNLVTRRTEGLPLGDLAAMRDILVENRDDMARFICEDPRGAHLVPFVEEITRALESEKSGILEELSGLQHGVEHIGDLVRSQQSLAGRQGVLEPTDLSKQLDQALSICEQAGRSHDDLDVVREYDELPKLEVDRHKLTEVLVNLVKNALDAMRDAPTKRLTLRLAHDGTNARIEISDSGIGIEKENLARVFGHGFTTKSDGHGYGLHVSANAATEMGGDLTATSEGAGHGATFVLTLPAAVHALAQAA